MKITSLCLIFFSALISVQFQALAEETVLIQGLEMEEKGEYEQALGVWSSAFTELESPSLAIGREYIRLVTEQNLRSHYETASSIYLWGLTAEEIEPNRQALEQELAMLAPLAHRQTTRKWRRLLEEGDPGLYRELRAFWQQLNPTPHTRYNERLLEHWERITYAREHYNRSSDPPYGTDDRGPVYVQYGEPDRLRTGNLSLQWGVVYNECRIFPGCNPEAMSYAVMDLNSDPYYEIWIYDRPNRNMGENLVVIFGENPGSGFSRVEVIDELIPNRAFSFNSRALGSSSPGSRFTPGMMMQFLYYQQLAGYDAYFAGRFSLLINEWDVGESPTAMARLGKYQGPMQRQMAQTEKWQIMRHAPNKMSTYERTFPSIPVRAYPYRMLDKQNRPVAATFLESQPRQVFLEDFAFNEDFLLPDEDAGAEQAFAYYELTHGLQVVGPGGEVLSSSRLPAELILDFREDLPSSSVFTVPYIQEGQQITLYSELHNRHPNSKPRVETPFPQELRGLGKLEFSLPEPLNTDPAVLEMGDLVLGWQMRHDAPEGTLFPFVVANGREIPEGEELAVHVEIYNLQRGGNGFTNFTIDYEVVPVRAMEWLRGRTPQDMSLTLEQQTTAMRFIENLEIRTRELDPGRYRLRLTATDNSTGQQVEREIEFRVVERQESGEFSSG